MPRKRKRQQASSRTSRTRSKPAPERRLVAEATVDLGRIWQGIQGRAPAEHRVAVRRPDDLVVLELVFENLEVDPKGPPRLVRKNPNARAYVIAEFPPQSFGEEAFLAATGTVDPPEKETSDQEGYPPKNVGTPAQSIPAAPFSGPLPLARVRMAGRSRIAVAMPSEAKELPYTLHDVLAALRTWPMRLDVSAAPEPEDFRFRERAEVTFDRDWLRAVTESAAWDAAATVVHQGLGEAGLAVQSPIEKAAARLGEIAAGALAQGRKRGLGARLHKAMEAELDRLAERHPELREGARRETGFAALALASARALAKSRRKFDLDASVVGRIPFLTIALSPHAPARGMTALELPYRLIVSPLETGRWRHSAAEVERRGRTELWHTRLSTGGDERRGADRPSKVRAIWSPDYPMEDEQIFPLLGPPPRPFRTSLDPLDRKMLVKLMAGFDEWIDDRRAYHPRASVANRFMLSALGGLLDSEGNWRWRPERVDLEQWRHLSSLGRDHYVRVVYAGFLCPFGHAASLIKVTERKFEWLGVDPSKERVAVLRQRFFIVVREPVKDYDGSDHVFDGNTFPFTSVEILTRVTPNLVEPGEATKVADPSGSIYAAVPPRGVFWPLVSAGSPFMFDVAATDLCGNRVTFAMPLLFVGETANTDLWGAVRNAYNGEPAGRRSANLGGATICFAPLPPDEPDPKGDPRLPTSSIAFDAGNVKSKSRFHPNFYPEIETAQVGIRAVQRLLGQPQAVVGVKYPNVYRDNGFAGPNAGEVFLQTLADYALDFGGKPNQAKSDALGALATPSMAIQGLSRIMGPAADLGAIKSNSFNPANFFKDAKILGGISLASLLDVVTGLAGADVPKMLSRELPKDGALPQRVEASFKWETEIKKTVPLFIPRADQVNTTTLSMSGVVTTPVADPAAASYEATARLDNFKVNLFGFIILWFDLLTFEAKRGQKPDVAVEIHPGDEGIAFGGPLEFVNGLRSLIPSNGFSDPPALSVTPSGIAASFSLNLPAVQVGVFALSNASLGAGFALPFDSKPATVRFNFSERQHPFSLTVSLLGGGGFFAIGIGSAGVKEIEAALEFGAAVAIDLGVASGGVEIKAGVYFHWLEPVPNKGSVELAGYVRLHGELSVLGIISASLTFNLQIAYLKEDHKSIVWGEATLVIEIEVLFFSADVSVRCRREFAGSESDPTFLALIPSQATWNRYCNAFAEEAA